jgi:aminoglycoside phosphotransferase (APT) family kinase protein
MIDPNQSPDKVQTYLSQAVGAPLKFTGAERLPKSTREAPWRLNAQIDGLETSYVLRLESRDLEYEYQVMRAMMDNPFPTPTVYGWDPSGEWLGEPCFLCDYLEGSSLLPPMLAGEGWAETLYLESVAALQAISAQALEKILASPRFESAADVLEQAWVTFQENPHPLAERAYRALTARMPQLPELRFSNGDLWLDNFIVKHRKLVGVIDFENAGFSDPIYEFLLSFFVAPELQSRGIEARYCRMMDFDPALLPWYHGLEFFDTLHYLLPTGESFVHHTVASLEADLERWLDEFEK